MMKLNCLPSSAVTLLNSSERMLGRLMQMTVPNDKRNKSYQDLAGDLFWRYYLYAPENERRIPKDRKLNRAAMSALVQDVG